jgi:Zn-dependent protease
MVLSLSVHEFGHAWVATLLGDSTPRKQGRLTLSPVAHIDIVGTLLLPALSVLAGGMMFFGWARPVQVKPSEFREGVPKRLGMALVSLAGPLGNIFLAVLSATILAALMKAHVTLQNPQMIDGDVEMVPTPIALLLLASLQLNIGLAVFNLLPVPPLDGHRLLPRIFDRVAAPLQRYGFAVVMFIFLLLPQVANVIFYRPVRFLGGALMQAFGL